MDKKHILKVDRAHIWHPFTQMKDYENLDHLVITRAEGMKLYDADGNEYYDTVSSWWTSSLGHRHPRIMNAIRAQLEQLDHVIFAGITHPYATGLIEKLKQFLPDYFSRYFFSDNGSTAVEVALKMAFQYFQNLGKTRKRKFVMLEGAYHGDTIGSVSVGGIDLYHKLYKPLMFESFMVDGLNCSTCPFRKSAFTRDAKETQCRLQCFDRMQKTIEQHHEEIAAVIVEPLLQGAAGMRVYPAEYLNRLRKLTEEYQILLIFDEVATGFGRTGTLFAFQQTEVIPDILCLSKALTAGSMPLALTITGERIYNAFYDDYDKLKTFFHGHSYTGHPVACMAAQENLNIIRDEKLPGAKKEVIHYFHQKVREFEAYDFIQDVRYIGFIGAVDIVKDRGKKQPFDPAERIGFKIYLESLKEGLLLRPLGDTIYWFLPMIVETKDLDIIFERSHKVIQKVVSEYA
jgi:adenosylmethionine-8-amino-7-oxononanoate aminotransferase